jgi:hypothetical protein
MGNTKNYAAQGGDKWVIGGILEITADGSKYDSTSRHNIYNSIEGDCRYSSELCMYHNWSKRIF